MINGAHAILYSDDADATRAALAKVLGTRSVDAGGGWLIFALPPAELAVHPAEAGGRAELYLLCDDVAATVAALQGRGDRGRQADQRPGLGLLTAITLPGGIKLGLTSPPPDRGPADLSPRRPVRKSWRTLASSPGHRLATLPLWLGGHDFSRPNRGPSGMGGRCESGRRVRVERDCTSPSQRIAVLAGGSGDGDRGVTHGTRPVSW